MIKVDLSEIELLSDLLVRTASDTEEALGKLRQVSREMQEDVELSTYLQAPMALESISGAIAALNRGNDTLQSLKNVLLSVEDTYQETEKKAKNALNRMTVSMDAAGVGYNCAMAPEGIKPPEQSDEITAQEDLQQLVSDNVQQLQAINIAAITKVVTDEYEVSSVAELPEKD